MNKKASNKNIMQRKSGSKRRPTKENKKIKSLSKMDKFSPKKIEKYLTNFLKKFRKEPTDEKQKVIMQNYLQKRPKKGNVPKNKPKADKFIHANFTKEMPHFINPEYKRRNPKRSRFSSNWSEFKEGIEEKDKCRINRSLGVSRLQKKSKNKPESFINGTWFKNLKQMSRPTNSRKKDRPKKKSTSKKRVKKNSVSGFPLTTQLKESHLSGKDNWDTHIPLINQSNQEYMHRRNLVNQTLMTSGLLSTDFDLRGSHQVETIDDKIYHLPRKSLQGLTKKKGLHPKVAQMKQQLLREISGCREDSAVSVSFSESAGMLEIMRIYEDSIKELLSEGVEFRRNLIQLLKKDRGSENEKSFRGLKTSMRMYRVVKLLGKGSFGRVYLALQKLTNRLVAIKSLAKTAINDSSLKLKIKGEVDMMRTLTGHPFIISLLEVFENSKYVFFVTEYAANRDLLRALKKHSKFTSTFLKKRKILRNRGASNVYSDRHSRPILSPKQHYSPRHQT